MADSALQAILPYLLEYNRQVAGYDEHGNPTRTNPDGAPLERQVWGAIQPSLVDLGQRANSAIKGKVDQYNNARLQQPSLEDLVRP